MLRKRGHTDAEIEAIMRSKWANRVAVDGLYRYGCVKPADLAQFLDDHHYLDYLSRLVAGVL